MPSPSNDAFHLERLPQRMVIAGGGYINNEFAGIFNELGVKVTVVNRSDKILRHDDHQIRDRPLQISTTLRRHGVRRQADHGRLRLYSGRVLGHPPLAGVGMAEAQARKKLGAVKIYTADFRPMKNVLAGRNERALCNIVVDYASGKIVVPT